jgi:hypothetical protein
MKNNDLNEFIEVQGNPNLVNLNIKLILKIIKENTMKLIELKI